jgi:murein L,D-transpeptidase YcbB/YkuD
MRYLLLFLSLFLIISCKKESIKKVPPKKNDVIQREKPYEGKILKIDTTLYAKFESQVLIDFYKKYNHETVWQSTEFRKTVLNEFKNAENEGLFPEDYRFDKLNKLESKINKLNDKELVDYDLLLTYNLQKYIWHISQGKLNPKGIYDDWDLETKNTNVNAVLLKAFKENNLMSTIDSCKPQHVVYKRLKKAMEILNTFPKDTLKSISFSEKINPNDTIKSMISIKRRLMYWKDLTKQDTLTSIYDKTTVEAVKRFQTRHGLAADGVIGKGTLNALNFSKTKRKNQIMANLERWKWFNKKMGNEYVIVNIPDYKLRVVENNDTVKTHRVIVGTIKRKTPILSSKLSYAVFNPTWTVPPTILKEDIIPATIKNRGYLTSKNITVYDNTGNVVSASDWNPSKAKSYRYVQSPGSFNSLGMVKIIFPNKYSVYLHDTNHRDYFEKWNRSLSSGCVRVENPLELTSYLLKDSINYNLEKITEILKTGETKNASIKNPVYVHQWYWTAWSEDNKLIFRDDIYNLDEDLFKKMK